MQADEAGKVSQSDVSCPLETWGRRGDPSHGKGLDGGLESEPQEEVGGRVEAMRDGGFGKGTGRHRCALLIGGRTGG
jgi:hypothetical protein